MHDPAADHGHQRGGFGNLLLLHRQRIGAQHGEVSELADFEGAFPGFVECKLTDVHGREHSFVEKVPVVSAEHISDESTFPVAGYIRCEIESEVEYEKDHVLVRVDTTRPDWIESTSGQTKFELLPWQVLR